MEKKRREEECWGHQTSESTKGMGSTESTKGMGSSDGFFGPQGLKEGREAVREMASDMLALERGWGWGVEGLRRWVNISVAMLVECGQGLGLRVIGGGAKGWSSVRLWTSPV